jgi:hypothetical protein
MPSQSVGHDSSFSVVSHMPSSHPTSLGLCTGAAVTGFGIDPSDGDGVSMTGSITGLSVGDSVAIVGFLVEGRGVDRIVGKGVDRIVGKGVGGVSIGASDGLSVGAGDDRIWLFRTHTRIVCLSCSNEEHFVIPRFRHRLTSKQIKDTHDSFCLGRSAR